MTKDNTYPIRILHIASGDLWAGAEAQLFTLAKALKTNTNTIVDVILLNHGKLERELLGNHINVIVLEESKLNSLVILWKLVRIVHKIKPDVIHTHRVKENILGCLAARLSGNIPTIRTSHGAAEHVPSWKQLHKRIIRWLDFICGRYFQHAIVAVSEDLAEKLRKDFPSNKIHVIVNGIDMQAVNQHAIIKKSNDSTDIFNIGFAGRLVPVKRVDILIKTARHMLDNYPKLPIKFRIFGDGPLRDELERLNRKLNTDTIVTFEGHSDNIIEQIQMLDSLLLTSDHEGLPMILLEAMALGTPIISHAVGGIPDLLNHGSCGVLISENKAKNYALAINELFKNPKRVLDITTRALQRVNENYSAIANAQEYCLRYKSLLK